jgi:TolB protein
VQRDLGSRRAVVHLVLLGASTGLLAAACRDRPTGPALGAERIAFASDRDGDLEIYVANPDGSALRALTENAVDDYGPEFSPDGSRIVFASTRTGTGFWVMNADGSGQTQLAVPIGGALGTPRWSPDGSSIVFDAGVRRGADVVFGIHVVAPDGSGLRTLTTVSQDGQPTWSRDGSRIAFSSSGRA